MRRCKTDNGNPQIDIFINSLSAYFSSVWITIQDTSFLTKKVRNLRRKLLTNITVDDVMLTLYLKKTKLGCAQGIDGVMTEHLKYAFGTDAITVIISI